jgi:DNA-binding response OmpR family regulator
MSHVRVLICEDDTLIALGWSVLMATEGYTVVGPVHTAEKALEMAYGELPDVALIDIDLGGVIDGISVAAELAPLGVAVILITGDYQRAPLEGREFSTDILIKPVSERAVTEAVKSILRHKNEITPGTFALSA